MALTVNTNLSAMQAYQNLNKTSIEMASSMAKLSSGLRINTAADDAAGLSISEGLKSQVNGFGMAARNAQDGINVVQTADGALGEVHSILQRMRDLAVQAGNDSNNTASRTAIKTEGDALGQELDRITNSTNFNGIKLLDGSASGATALSFQIGADGSANSQIKVDFGNLTTSLTAGANSFSGTTGASAFLVDTATNAATTVTNLDTAIAAVSAQRSSLGASQNRLSHAMNIANVSAQNLAAAQSHITDTDMASEMVNYTKDSILSQAGTAMLAQANQSGQGVLKLLG
ncbi:Flagellin [Sinomonas atrocyanea]|uniref:Flagellin n=1 Tax=Sinomonas atrocyanea TaxID=37927 RepID=A0A126ZWD2_9MICC|nr:flagellin [Sinomonas atrocyanea]AMM31403.1 Flagellin [Sinomonas atrocyanea]GEB63687.1 flagellin [Sinomonas atrocyanea]GGG78298.1 flagellin [Sinomonas atrocyanea]